MSVGKQSTTFSALMLFIGTVATSLALAGPSAVIFTADFENSEVASQINTSGNPPVRSTDFARSGRYSMKSVLNRRNSPTSYRTEATTGGKVTLEPGEYWYGFSIYLPAGYKADSIWEVVAQWHNAPDPGEEKNELNPPMGLYIEDGNWRLNTLWDSRRITNKSNYEGKAEYRLGPHESGKWTDWVFHINWSYRSDGVLQVWKNGEKVVDKSGPIGFNDEIAPFFKMGMYKGWRDRNEPAGSVSERIVYHDELRIANSGGSYADVAPGGEASNELKPKPPTGVNIDAR